MPKALDPVAARTLRFFEVAEHEVIAKMDLSEDKRQELLAASDKLLKQLAAAVSMV